MTDKLTSRDLGLVDFEYFIEVKLKIKLWACQKNWVAHVQNVVDSDTYKGLQLLAPADHGKTHTLVVPLILWLLARDKNSRIILVRNTDAYAEQIGRAVKMRIDNLPVLRKEYGLERGAKWADAEMFVQRPNWEDSCPSLLCLGAGADPQSQRADYIITDDIATKKNSRTESQRAVLSSYFFTDLASRLDKTLSKKKVLVFGHRVHERDLYQENEDRPDWCYVTDRAIVDDTAGKILAPEGHTYEDLAMQRSKDPTGFELMYQQRNASLGIFVMPVSMERCRRPELSFHQTLRPEVRAAFQFTALSVDPAFSQNRWSSHCVMNLWGVKSNMTQTLLWAFRSKVSPEQLINLCEMKFRLFMPDHMLIEGNQGQILLFPIMRRAFPGHTAKFKPVITLNNDGSLPEDFNLLFGNFNTDSPKVEIPYAGPTEQSYYSVMQEEFCSYPNGARRDTLMAYYIMNKGLGLIKEETRRGYVLGSGVVGAVADSYRRPFANPFWRRVSNGW